LNQIYKNQNKTKQNKTKQNKTKQNKNKNKKKNNNNDYSLQQNSYVVYVVYFNLNIYQLLYKEKTFIFF